MRRKRKCRLWTLSIIWLMLIFLSTEKGANGQSMPDKIIIDKGIYSTDIYEGVPFAHGDHALDFAIACTICHHKWNQEEAKIPTQCITCHKGKDETKTPLRDAYMKQCRGCHSNLKLEGKPAGPTRCNACHHKKQKVR